MNTVHAEGHAMKVFSQVKQRPFVMGAGFLAALLVVGSLFAQRVNSATDKHEKSAVELDDPSFVFRATYINQVLPGSSGDDIKEVYKYPIYSSVFLVRTSRAVTVWERKNSSLSTLLDIKLDGDFKNLLFLEDGRTFVIHTSRSASVYSLDRERSSVQEPLKTQSSKAKAPHS